MNFLKKIIGKAKTVDVMLGICVHDPDTYIEPPSNVRNFATNSLSTAKSNYSLAADAKTAFLNTMGSKNFSQSTKQASNDLPDQMKQFMENNGIKPNNYNLEYFSESLSEKIMILWAIAIKKT